jgi:hypothetical protein
LIWSILTALGVLVACGFAWYGLKFVFDTVLVLNEPTYAVFMTGTYYDMLKALFVWSPLIILLAIAFYVWRQNQQIEGGPY